MNLDNLRLNSTHNPENNLIILIIIDEISEKQRLDSNRI